MELQGSKTEQNILTAFAGESQARNRYTFFASEAKKAVAMAQSLAGQTSWPLAVLAAAGHGKSLDEARARAQELAPSAELVPLSEEEQGDVGRIVEHAAHKGGFSLIVMGAYPDSWLHRLFFGGATEHVLSKVPGPIVLVH